MMTANVNLQAWLDTVPDTRPSVLVPYVRSPENGILRYQLSAVKHGSAGSSTIRQSGGVQVRANQPTALTRFALSVGRQDECRIELVLFAGDSPTGTTYRFECPRTP